jgi:hypothetical protein
VLTVCNGWSSSSFTVWPSIWNLVHGWCVKYVVWWYARYGHGGEAYKSRYMETLCWDHVYITHTHSLSLSLSLSKPSNSINQLQDTLCHLLVGALMKYISSTFETHLSLFPPQFSIWHILLLFVGIDCCFSSFVERNMEELLYRKCGGVDKGHLGFFFPFFVKIWVSGS